MGEILDILASGVFLCLVIPKTVIISRFLSIDLPRVLLWKASVGSFAISLVTLLIISTVTSPLLVAIAYSFSGSDWLQAVPYLFGYTVVTVSPGLFYERHMLLKGGIGTSTALKVCIMSNLYMLLAILVLALVLYIIAMAFF